MSLPGPQPHAPSSTALTVIMVVAGVLLLLPGLCAIFFAGSMVASDGVAVFRDIGSGDPIMVLILLLWIVCFIALLLGVWLLRGAWRRGRP